jgi:hypothetical protein
MRLNFVDGFYEGEVHQNKRYGLGKMTYSNGDVYEGYWVEDVIHGHGKMTFSDGTVYEGNTECVLPAPLEKLLWFRKMD